eukprot:TRINITY_DN16162_c0_g1_i1.p1 TRINITY_DN16162_c0_g1~~TRINITY_DN16162_c0_g1_i1.p1  ORF type:complete len:143 (+),score=36.46 TRINITY_DN16162_c0_g1_i1:48-476(+)
MIVPRAFLLLQGSLMMFPAAMNLWLVYFGPSASLIESMMLKDGNIVNHNDFLVQSFGFGLAHLMASLHAIFGALSPNRNLVPNVLAIMVTAAAGLYVQVSKPGLFPKDQQNQLYGIFGGEIVLGLVALYFALKPSYKKSHKD